MVLSRSNAACSGSLPPGHPAYTDTSWPVDTTWTIDQGTDCTGTTIYARGNIVITSTGSLNLKDSNLIFNMTSDGQYGITVKGNGRLDVVNSVIRAEAILPFNYSSPTARATNYYYKFVVEKNGILNIDNSDVSGMWGTDATPITDVHGGIEIYSSSVQIINSSIHDGKIMGIYISGSSPRIKGSEIYNNGRGSDDKYQSWIYPPGWNAEMANSHASGIFMVDASPIIEKVNVHHNWYWEYDGSKHKNNTDSGYYDNATAYRIYGTGIYLYNSTPYIGNSTIKYNGHDDDTWYLNYDDCGWEKCLKAEVGEGVGIFGIKSSPTVYNTTITKNKVGIYINEEKPKEGGKVFPIRIEKCDIRENWDAAGWESWRFYRGTGIYIEDAQNGLIKNNTIEYNGRPYIEARGWGDYYWSAGVGIGLHNTSIDILENKIQYHFRGIFGYETVKGRIAYNNITWNTHRPHESGGWEWWAKSWWYNDTDHFKFIGQGIWLELGCVPLIEYNVIDYNGAKYYEPNAPFRDHWESSWESHGIYCSVGSCPVVRYNEITWNGAWGVRSYDTSSPEVYNNNISWNGFKAYDNSWGVGIECGHGSTWKISNNTIMYNGNHHAGGAWANGAGIIGDWHSTEIIINNTICNNFIGVQLYGCRAGTIIEKNNISYNGYTYWWYPRGVGISIYSPISWSGQFPVIKNNYIAYNGFYGGHGPSVDYWYQAGIHSYQGGTQAKIGPGNVLEGNEYAFAIWSTILEITDTIIKDSFSSDFFLNESSVVTLINSTHEKGRVIYGDDSSIIKACWYIDLKLIWNKTKAPVQYAGIDLYDSSSEKKYTLSTYTGVDGKTKRLTLLEYEYSAVKVTKFSPYKCEIFVKGRNIANASIEVNKTMSITIRVDEVVPPQITITTPKQNAILNSTIIEITGSAYDDLSGMDVIDIAVGAGEWLRVPSQGLTTWSYTLVLPGDGNYTVSARATDRAGNYAIANVNFTVNLEKLFYVAFPPDNYTTSKSKIRVVGIADIGLVITINGESVSLYERSFSKEIDLTEGKNIIKIEARDIVGNVKTESRVVILDTIKPFIQINFPPNNYETNKNIVTIEGITEEGAVLTINGEDVPVVKGSFTKNIVLKTGPNPITIEAIDKAGNENRTTLNIKYDNIPPNLSLSAPHQNALLNTTELRVIGITEENAIVTINDKKVDVKEGRFDYLLKLTEGINTIVVIASDGLGNQNIIVRSVYVDTIPPVLVIAEPKHGEATNKNSIRVAGITEEGAEVKINGVRVNVTNNKFSYEIKLENGENLIEISAYDKADNNNSIIIHIILDTIPPAVLMGEPKISETKLSKIEVKGKTEPGAKVYINGIEVEVNENGEFSYPVKLSEGKNTIEIRAIDKAGNEKTEKLVINREVPKGVPSFPLFLSIAALIIGVCLGLGVAGILVYFTRRKKTAI
ncbi:MAG: right-handed parallel beta-helix repeat-containing protein [Candidatus Thermoplasmatota archaeon]